MLKTDKNADLGAPSTEPSTDEAPLEEQIRAAADLLEKIGEDRAILAQVDKADQRRLIHAAGKVWTPDEARRRQLTRALAKKRKAEATSKEDRILNGTGIRTLRSKPTFTTPNIFPPALAGTVGNDCPMNNVT